MIRIMSNLRTITIYQPTTEHLTAYTIVNLRFSDDDDDHPFIVLMSIAIFFSLELSVLHFHTLQI